MAENRENRFWSEMAGELQRALHLHDITDEEATREYQDAADEPLSDEELEDGIAMARSGIVKEPSYAERTTTPAAFGHIDQEVDEIVAVYRHEGGLDTDVEEEMRRRRQEAIGVEIEPAASGRAPPAGQARAPSTQVEHRVAEACRTAESLIERLGIGSTPVDPVAIANTERRLLRLCPGNYKNAFDGRLEYLLKQKLFLCYYNTKYDRPEEGGHAPRTRFSLAHELGHFFIESHHDYLRCGGEPHPSKSEFSTPAPVERQADAFAAHLLMPDRLIKPLVNQDELSVAMIADLANTFRTSFVSTAIRAVECTHFCCAVAGIKEERITWMRRGEPLVESGVYPGERGPVRSVTARQAWHEFLSGATTISERSGWARDWFRIYDDALRERLSVTETYLPAPILDTLLVVLTIPEDELLEDDN